MVDNKAQSINESAESSADSTDSVDLSDIQASWKRVWDAQKDQLSKVKDLAYAEFSLSAKALLLCAISVLMLVGIVLITWVGILVTIAYASYSFGLHWLSVSALILALNLLLFYTVIKVFKRSSTNVGLSTTFAALSESQNVDNANRKK